MKDKPDIVALVKAANLDNPDPAAIKAVQKAFREDRDLWLQVSSLGMIARSSILDTLGVGDGDQLALEAQVNGERRRLGYREASPLCKILIDHVITTWLRLTTISLEYDAKWGGGSVSLAVAAFWEKRLSAAQRRYLRAVETLARVRKVESHLPQVQINIAGEGGQQVVAGEVNIDRGGS